MIIKSSIKHLNNMRITIYLTIILVFFNSIVFCQTAETERIYLSGKGYQDEKTWQFQVSEGRNSGEWTTIPVPSNWEQFGFGSYNYGHAKDEERGKEIGFYKYEFKVPSSWQNQKVEIVFEGSMTDTQVKINNKLAGPIHQGAFYRFSYDISDQLNFGEEYNLLEVKVAKHSENESVNRAERYADFWIFGGIFRPVYLQMKPVTNINRTSVNAKANGSFTAEIYLDGPKPQLSVEAQVFTLSNKKIGKPFSAKINKGKNKVQVHSTFTEIKPWNPEQPQLYKVRFQLLSNKKVVHEVFERFGFRTVELRERDGIYVNGVKIKFKGVNRHTFWPTAGRTSSKKRSIEDVKLIKSMNMNAVRMSHYPPDTHFLDVADSLGLFVLNELAGWHNSYDTDIGHKLVKAMVTRDVNHPSIILWNNGNEGGHNYELDTIFPKYDIQKRKVVHPWQTFNGMSNEHYRPYNYGVGTYWQGHEVVFPTEFLHGMYDGGSGAGLRDFWDLIWEKPQASGGFLWVFADEGVKRTDTGELDTYKGSAADGILGPFHEKEGSYFAIKEIWAPIQFQDLDITETFNGSFQVENQYFYTNLNELTFSWKLVQLPLPNKNTGLNTITGTAVSPDIEPGRIGELQLELPPNWFQNDALYITAKDKFGTEVYTWSWPIKIPEETIAELMANPGKTGTMALSETEEIITIEAGGIKYQIGKKDGLLREVRNTIGEIPFNNGPHLSAGKVIFKSLETIKQDGNIKLVASFEKGSRMKEFTWTFFPSGWAKLELYYKPEEYDVDFDFMGVDFDYPENLVTGVEWVGKGPYRVWKNRLQGASFGWHQKDYNNTITGVSPLIYPEFKGYHSNLYWAKIKTKEQDFLVATSTEDVFLRLFTPQYPQSVYEARTSPSFPEGDISFMQAIPAIGSKTNQPERLGPSGQKNIFFDYGTFDDWRLRSKHMVLYFDFSVK
ncbi:glycoside hydrolase family 2 TIM barrel-domain containing protein [Arenibacter sp. ARW7G5Y1]|uniref:glycoside hydrolase family 2 TIM barrel-domain containing protein n=1 Tax=Arenibacter sp. ARW7G5Y1 TaxID=2135619 RepID=UPI001C654126|nr:glycoside hydrolase family 2 TIM barrel-domain containing protein [Arenibacter sp. ARW7G5Y1]